MRNVWARPSSFLPLLSVQGRQQTHNRAFRSLLKNAKALNRHSGAQQTHTHSHTEQSKSCCVKVFFFFFFTRLATPNVEKRQRCSWPLFVTFKLQKKENKYIQKNRRVPTLESLLETPARLEKLSDYPLVSFCAAKLLVLFPPWKLESCVHMKRSTNCHHTLR